MSAIDEMYEKYEVQLVCTAEDCHIQIVDKKECGCCICEHFKYPPFTAEKQLELIKFIILYPDIDEVSQYYDEPSKTYYIRVFAFPDETGFRKSATECNNDLESCIASMIVRFYDDLTPTQRQKVKEILER